MALTIVEPTAPVNSSLDVAINSYIKLPFNTEVDNAYLQEAIIGDFFQLYEKATFIKQGIIAGKTADNNLNVYITPLNPLKTNTEYILVILGGASGIKNTLAEPMAQNYALEFTTGVTVTIDSIVITDLIVDFVAIGTGTPTDTTDSTINFQDVNNTIGSETGVYIYDAPGMYIEDGLYLEYSSPSNGSTGVTGFQKMNLYFSENITDVYSEEIRIKKTTLPYEADIFGNHDLSIQTRTITNNKLEMLVDETGLDITKNKEYTVIVPKGAFKQSTNPTVKNDNLTIRFSGPLSPMLSTPDYVKNLVLGFTAGYLSDLTDYDIFKTLHINSKEVIMLLGIALDYNDVNRLYWLTRYVTCKTALDLVTGPFGKGKGTVTQRNVLGQSTSWSLNTNTAAKYSPLEECIRTALRNLGIGSIGTNVGVKSVDSPYYPNRTRVERKQPPIYKPNPKPFDGEYFY